MKNVYKNKSTNYVKTSSPSLSSIKHNVAEKYEHVSSSKQSYTTTTPSKQNVSNNENISITESTSLPFKSLFAKENYLATQFDSSLSNSQSTNDSYEYITKYKSSISYLQSNDDNYNNICNLQQQIINLKEELLHIKKQNKKIILHNKQLQNELEDKNFQLQKYYYEIKRYKEMLHKHFDFFALLSDIININDVLIKGDVEFYIENKYEHDLLLDNYKRWFLGLVNEEGNNGNLDKYEDEKRKDRKDCGIKVSKSYSNYKYLGRCFACEVGCNVSNSGYSAMTFWPYDVGNKRRRKAITPINKKKNKKFYNDIYDITFNQKEDTCVKHNMV